jgi:ribose transport system substrate-binding protein
MKKRSFYGIVAPLLAASLLVVLFLTSGCSTATQPEAPSEEGSTSTSPASDEEYIYVSCMGNLEFFNAHKYGWKWAGEKLGVKTTYVGPAEYDLNAMIAAFDQAIAKQPKGIVVFAVEPVLIPSINKAAEAGIPVVTILGDLPDSKRVAFVGSHQYDLGFLGGERLAESLGGEGKIAILSIPGVQMFDDREAGYRAAFEDYPGIEVVQVGDTKADTVTAINTAKDIMQRFPELAAFASTDSTGGIGSATAVEEAGKVGQVKIVSMDRNSDVLEKIEKGTITGTVVQDDAAMPYWALLVLYNYVHNQPPLTTDNLKAEVQAEPEVIYTSVNYADETNLQYFLEANKMYQP